MSSAGSVPLCAPLETLIADKHIVKLPANGSRQPYQPNIQLAGLYASQGNWDGVLRLTRKVIGLDANAYPDAYFLEAFAFYNLKRLPEAEYTARKAVQTDKQHRFPRAELCWVESCR